MLERFKVPEKDRVYVKQERMRDATETIFKHVGMDDEGAKISTDVLMLNDLRGNESHGVSNGLRRYVDEYAKGTLNARPNYKIIRETSTTATVDGDWALGAHVGPWAMEMAVEKASKHGMGAVAVINTGHLAGCGYHAMVAVDHGMIGHCMTAGGAGQTVPPWGSQPFLGTNPIAYAAPARSMPPYLFDVATSQVANNKIGLARRTGATILGGWVTGLDGEPVMEEIPAPQNGEYHLLHIGGTRENGAHKGFGFALMNEIMCNELSGMGPGPMLGHPGGHFFAAYDIEAFTDRDKFLDEMDALLKATVAIPPDRAHERVVYPGLLEHEEVEKRTRDGIPYHREVVEWFNGHLAEIGSDVRVS